VLEAEGLATVQLTSIRSYAERIRPPRALYCEFPLGRPLGRPNDPRFQRRVLEAALALLERPSGPVLEDFPETIADEAGAPLDCRIPPRHDPDAPPAVDEARGLRSAYERQLAASGRTNVGHVIGPDAVPGALSALLALTDGKPLEESGLPADLRLLGLDIRAYYEEAAIALAGHVPAARQAESWLFRRTEAGKLLKRAQVALRQSGAPRATWFYLVPSTQQDA
jgi:hypothetical protein